MAVNNQVAPATPLRSCMKVATLEESLDSCDKRSSSKSRKLMWSSSRKSRLSIRGSRDSRVSGHGDQHSIFHRLSLHYPRSSSPHVTRRSPHDTRRTTAIGRITMLFGHDGDHEGVRSITDSDEAAPPQDAPPKKGLTFHQIIIREYEVTASDNPAVTRGVALELGWNYNILPQIHIDLYELRRANERSPNFQRERKLTSFEREKVLKEFGATQKDMREAAKRAAIIRNKRKKSLALRKHDKLYEMLEERRDVTKRFCRLGGRSERRGFGVNSNGNATGALKLHPTLMTMFDNMSEGISQATENLRDTTRHASENFKNNRSRSEVVVDPLDQRCA